MLEITIPAVEQWDEVNQQFVSRKAQTLKLEHSLVSLSKWESKWCKPFLSKQEKTPEETADYVRCMSVSKTDDPNIFNCLTSENIVQINKYIEAPMTATWFTEHSKGKASNEQVTAELIYYWMIALNIPFECQKWHLNRLLTLIKVCNVKNQPPKNMSKSAVMRQQAAQNAARRRRLNSRG